MKKGFILIETIVVMSIVMIALIGIYGTYTSIVKNQTQRSYYDNINDVYRLNIIKDLVGDSFLNSGNFNYMSYSECNVANCANIIAKLIEEGTNISMVLIPSGFNITTIPQSYNYKNSLTRYLETTNYNNSKLIILRYEKDGNEYFTSLEV